MEAEDASRHETPKTTGISASSVPAPVDHLESAISSTPEGSGSPPTAKSTTIYCRAYRVGFLQIRIRFDIWKPTFLEKSGIRLEEGKMYTMSGKIGDVCTFRVRHRESANPHLYVFAPHGMTNSITEGEEYPITIETAEESNVARVVMSHRGPVIAFYQTVLRSMGIDRVGEGLTEYVLVNRTQGGGPRRVFGNYNRKLGWVQLYVQSTGVRVDDIVELVSLRAYTLGDFVEDFSSAKREPLENVQLRLEEDGLKILVDSLMIPLLNPSLTSHGLKVTLSARIKEEDHEEIRFEFDGERITPSLSNSSSITGFRSYARGLNISYERGWGKSYVWRMRLPGLAQDQPPSQDYSWLKDAAQVISRPEDGEGWYLLAMDPDIRDKVRMVLDTARSYNREKGNISENIVRYLMPSLGLSFVASHPWRKAGADSDTVGHGPDTLLRELKAAELDYMEVKWHRELEGVADAARQQLEGYLAVDWRYSEEPVRGAYVAILDWNVKDPVANLFIQKVQ